MILPLLPLDNLSPIQQKTLSLYPTYQKFFNDYKPAQLLVTYDDVNTIEQSLSIPRMTIDDIRLIYPEENKNCSVDYLVNWLGFINRLSNINKPLTELDSVAYMIFKDHKLLYLSDLKIIFEKIMKAEYGTFYGSVDAQRILYAFVQYSTERNLLESKNRVETQLKQETKKIEKTELQKHIEDIERKAKAEVSKIMKESYSDLRGPAYLDKKNELINEIVKMELEKDREQFLEKHGEVIPNHCS